MVGTLLLLALVVPQGGATASLVADRTTAQVGDSMTISIAVRAVEAGPVDIDEPVLAGFDVVERRDRSRVSVGTGIRTTERDLVLRARQPGDFSLGPFRVRIAGAAILTNAVRVSVTLAQQPGDFLSPQVRTMVEGAMPEGADLELAVEVAVLRPADSVQLGDQIDLVVTAWFPRETRARLRAPPSLLPPDVRGAWGYTQSAPAGVVLSRELNGQVYDLFVHHEIVFALTPGDLEVGPAKVTYSLPISGSFLSREIRHEAQSVPFLIAVAPIVGMSSDRTVAGRNLTIEIAASETLLPVGDAARVTVRLAGAGNVALWPEPELKWPAGVQAYQERSAVDVTSDSGMLGGTKQFDYLVVADSAGIHRLPSPTYEYFDLDQGRVVAIRAEAIVFETPESTRRAEPLRGAPPLLRETWILRGLGALRGRGAWFWILAFALPPLVAGMVRMRVLKARGPARDRSPPARRPDVLALLEDDIRQALGRLAPGFAGGADTRLANALIAAGVEPTLAAHVSRVRERLRHALYGPGSNADADELTEEAGEVLRALKSQGRRNAVPRIVGVLLVAIVTVPTTGEAQSVERLWAAGAARAVAESLTVRSRAEPHSAVQWFNLSLAWEQLGESARARDAWVRAVRLAPHHPRIRRAGNRWSDQAAPVLWVGPLSPIEVLGLSALCWALGWTAVTFRHRSVTGRVALLVAVAGVALAGVMEWRYASPYVLILGDETPLREAPYGPAPSRGILEAADAVVVERRDRDWRLVSVRGTHGWLHVSEVLEP